MTSGLERVLREMPMAATSVATAIGMAVANVREGSR